MSITYSVFFSFADGFVPNYSEQWNLLRETGMGFMSSGYYYTLNGCEIIDAPGYSAVDNFDDFDQLAPEMKCSLVQQWEHDNGSGVTLGYVLSGRTRIGVLRFLSADVDGLSQLFIGGKHMLPYLLVSLISTLKANRLLAFSDMAISSSRALTLMFAPDFAACLNMPGICGLGCMKPELEAEPCSGSFQGFSTEQASLCLRWPFC